MSSPRAPEGEVSFWLTRVTPGWHADAERHAWPDFALDGLLVSACKHPEPCRLHLRILGLAAHPIELSAPCPELREAPIGLRGIEVQLRWGAGEVALWLNGDRMAEAVL
jgi:hypothetical protein